MNGAKKRNDPKNPKPFDVLMHLMVVYIFLCVLNLIWILLVYEIIHKHDKDAEPWLFGLNQQLGCR